MELNSKQLRLENNKKKQSENNSLQLRSNYFPFVYLLIFYLKKSNYFQRENNSMQLREENYKKTK